MPNNQISLFQTSAFRIDNAEDFFRNPEVSLIIDTMEKASYRWQFNGGYLSFSLSNKMIDKSGFDDVLPNQESIIVLLECIERHIIDDDTCSVTYISSKAGREVNCYQMQIQRDSCEGNFVNIDGGDVFGTIAPMQITGVSPAA